MITITEVLKHDCKKKQYEKPIQVLAFPFGVAQVFVDRTTMHYYLDPVPVDLQFPSYIKKSRTESAVTDSQNLFRYFDSVIMKRSCDYAIVGIAKSRPLSTHVTQSDVYDVTFENKKGRARTSIRMSFDDFIEFRASVVRSSAGTYCNTRHLLEDFLVYADLEM